ncbi:MAG: TetR/AcrR family transcriptional regulator [Actinomycetota bacterium]
MASRSYDLGRRSIMMEDTRRRIVEAAIALHRDQGIMSTSYTDIARRAAVGVGTIYNHFPVIDDLVRACGGRLSEITRPPNPGVFTGLRSREARLERLVSEVFAWYERYPAWRRAVCDADKLEAIAHGVKARNAVIRRLVAAALGSHANSQAIATTRALIDYEVYRNLVEAGRSTAAAARAVARVLTAGI